ncbi:MAG: phosphoribosyltransferase domain-containing protein [Myxococcales bacterium]|nr:phosphoribosyltransferase domain-containing protein [Myxococcales bacterium]
MPRPQRPPADAAPRPAADRAPGIELDALLTVERDGNPRRRHGMASPVLGKLADADFDALETLARWVAAAVPPAPGPTLVVGLAESSLILAWTAHRHLADADLCLSSRTPTGHARERRFREPHSHAPHHHLVVPDREYARVVIIEDEVTTGRTLANLIEQLTDVAPRFDVVTLADLRPLPARRAMRADFARRGLQVAVRAPAPPQCLGRPRPARAVRLPQPPPDVVYAVGERVELPLRLLAATPPGRRPRLRHVTRSPWRVDGAAVQTRLDLGHAADGAPYFLYNLAQAPRSAAWIVGDALTRPVVEALGAALRAGGVRTTTFLDPPD